MDLYSTRKSYLLMFLLLLFLTILFWAPFVGMKYISPLSLFEGGIHQLEFDILFQIRFPRVLGAGLAGGALAVSGMAFQALFRNPLATPFTLGVAGGASFGASMYIISGVAFSLLNIPGVTIAAFLGALLSVSIVYGLTRASGTFSSGNMLLAGVAISFFFSSAIFFAQYVSDYTQSFRIMRWLMGNLEVHGFRTVFEILPFIVMGTLAILYVTHDLNLLATGEEEAIGRGVSIQRTKLVLFFSVSLMMGAIVSSFGPIGFIGMMVPHICRLMIGANHQYLLPATILVGATFLILCDMMSRILISPAEIPVGIITALLGGPFFLWLLVRRKGLELGA